MSNIYILPNEYIITWKKNMTEENTIQEFRLEKMNETRYYNWKNKPVWFNE